MRRSTWTRAAVALACVAGLSACGGGNRDSNVVEVRDGTQAIPSGRYAVDLDYNGASGLFSAGSMIFEIVAPEHSRFDSVVLFKHDEPAKYTVVFLNADATPAEAYGCRSAAWTQAELTEMDTSLADFLDGVGDVGGIDLFTKLPVCADNRTDIENRSVTHRVWLTDLVLPSLMPKPGHIGVTTLIEYKPDERVQPASRNQAVSTQAGQRVRSSPASPTASRPVTPPSGE